MHVPVDDEDALDSVPLSQVVNADRDVVEKAKPHRSIRLGVMPGWAHEREAVVDIAGHDRIQQMQHATDRESGRLERCGGNGRIGVERAGALPCGCSYACHMRRDVIERKFLVRRETRLQCDQVLAAIVGERVTNDTDPVWTFGMPPASVMRLVAWVDNEPRPHGRNYTAAPSSAGTARRDFRN